MKKPTTVALGGLALALYGLGAVSMYGRTRSMIDAAMDGGDNLDGMRAILDEAIERGVDLDAVRAFVPAYAALLWPVSVTRSTIHHIRSAS